jgi:arsenate reductase (glutaredoxin)
MIQIYHNSRCGKSRNCLLFLENSKKDFEIINYLIDKPTFDDLTEILKKLNFSPLQLIRQKETIWRENFKNKNLSDQQIIQAMVDFPILIERPIVINGEIAIIARDLEKIGTII